MVFTLKAMISSELWACCGGCGGSEVKVWGCIGCGGTVDQVEWPANSYNDGTHGFCTVMTVLMLSDCSRSSSTAAGLTSTFFFGGAISVVQGGAGREAEKENRKEKDAFLVLRVPTPHTRTNAITLQ